MRARLRHSTQGRKSVFDCQVSSGSARLISKYHNNKPQADWLKRHMHMASRSFHSKNLYEYFSNPGPDASSTIKDKRVPREGGK